MLCDRILGNLANANGNCAPHDWGEPDFVDLAWDECCKRALHKQSRGGRDVKILLPLGVRLRHGDVLFAAQGQCVAVNVPPSEVLVARPSDLRQMGLLAFELGNLHAPVELSADEIIALSDGPVEALFTRYGLAFERQIRQFNPLPVDVAPHLRLAQDFRVM